MKKLFFTFLATSLLLFLLSGPVQADLVPCGNTTSTACQLNDLFTLIKNVFNFFVAISTALAGLLIVIGGVTLLISGGNPGLASRGKQMIWGSVIGIVVVWCAWLVIHTVLIVIGYNGPI